jgi:hypothetical protein
MNARTPLPIKAIAGTTRYGLKVLIFSGIEYIQSPHENPVAEMSSAVGPNRRKCQRTPRGGVSVFAKRLFMCWARSHQVNSAGMRVNEIARTSQNTTEPTGDSTGSTESLPSSCHRTMCKPWLSVQKSHLAEMSRILCASYPMGYEASGFETVHPLVRAPSGSGTRTVSPRTSP